MEMGSNKLRAVLFILLLAGHDCHRIQEAAALQAGDLAGMMGTPQAHKNPFKGIFGGSDVCSASETSSLTVERYMKKVDTLLDLSSSIDPSNPSLLAVFQLSKRFKKWKSCMKPEVIEVMPDELKQLMEGTGVPKYNEQNVMSKVLSDLTPVLAEKGGDQVFPERGGCGFYPTKIENSKSTFLNPSITDRNEGLRLFYMEVYGCEKDDALAYQDSLPHYQKMVSKLVMKVAKTLVEAKTEKEYSQETMDAVNNLVATVDAVDEQLESETQTEVQAKGASAASSLVEVIDWALVIILVVIAIILTIMIQGFVSFVCEGPYDVDPCGWKAKAAARRGY